MTSTSKIDELLQSTDTEESIEYLKNYLQEKEKQLAELGDDASELEREKIQLDIARSTGGCR